MRRVPDPFEPIPTWLAVTMAACLVNIWIVVGISVLLLSSLRYLPLIPGSAFMMGIPFFFRAVERKRQRSNAS